MTTKQQRATVARETSERARAGDQDEARERSTGSSAALARVLAHLWRRAHSHPDSPATGFDPMSAAEWRARIAKLRLRGYRITASIVTKGDRVANEIGYSLVGESPPPGP